MKSSVLAWKLGKGVIIIPCKGPTLSVCSMVSFYIAIIH
jgi:hypothetical protein